MMSCIILREVIHKLEGYWQEGFLLNGIASPLGQFKGGICKIFCKWIESVLTIISLLIEADQSGTYRKIFGDFR